jgi:uncharacterized protein YjbI with pentapeptide repeats
MFILMLLAEKLKGIDGSLSMGRCSYTWEELDGEKQCSRNTLEDSDKYCIFHDPSPDKNRDLFKEKLKEQMKSKIEKNKFIGYYFPEDVDFFGQKFKTDADFRGATFHDIDFEGKIFQGDADFRGATFHGISNFRDAIFQNTTKFSGAAFQNAYFEEATFQSTVLFIGATLKAADFRGATFKDTNFSGVTFQGDADFRGATFQSTADFPESTFQDTAIFFKAIFHNANFSKATLKAANFMEAEFQGYAEFDMSVFSSTADFRKAEFQDAYFSKATFQNANFRNTIFLGDIDFSEAVFYQIADFENCKIADFGNGKKEKRMNLENAKFHDELFLINIKRNQKNDSREAPIFDFKGTRFSNKTRIENINLEKALFKNSRAELVDFSGAEFPKEIWEEKLLKKRFAYKGVEDEAFTNEEQDYCPKNWIEVRDIYKKLKQAHVSYGILEKAENFGYKEWECRRKSKSIVINILYAIFLKYFLWYGKKPWRLLISAGIIILLFSGIYLATGIEIYDQELDEYKDFDSFTAPWERCLYFSVITFTTVGYGDVHPHSTWARRFAMIEAIIGVSMIAFFVATFARRFI